MRFVRFARISTKLVASAIAVTATTAAAATVSAYGAGSTTGLVQAAGASGTVPAPAPEPTTTTAPPPPPPPTTVAPTTTAAAPARTRVAPARPARRPAPRRVARPVTAPKPAPAPAPSDPRDPGTGNLDARVQAALEASVPAAWLQAMRPRVSVIGGSTSWASSDGQIKVSTTHARGSWSRVRSVVAHEYGHLIAFRYGTQAYPGAAPEGWPAAGSRPEERWADCVAQAFTGIVDPSHGLSPCVNPQLSWTASWVRQSPSSHPVTG